jgi:hypothetical protein
VLARDPTNFAARFPAAPLHGLYTGKLDNGGETLTLHDPLDGTTFTLTYDDAPPWPTNADGYGPSLHRVRFAGSPSDATQWAAGTPTPGAPPSADILDTDGDGLPDAWETAHDTNPLAPDANADPDHDGLSNWQEYIAGTHPNNPASCLKLGAYSDCGSAVVTLEAISNRTYTIFYTDGLEPSAWTKLADVPARSTNWVVSLSDPAATTNRFYRVVTPQQP